MIYVELTNISLCMFITMNHTWCNVLERLQLAHSVFTIKGVPHTLSWCGPRTHGRSEYRRIAMQQQPAERRSVNLLQRQSTVNQGVYPGVFKIAARDTHPKNDPSNITGPLPPDFAYCEPLQSVRADCTSPAGQSPRN